MSHSEEWRWEHIKPEFEIRSVPGYGTGLYAVNKETGEVCDCKMEWNEEGTVLSCPVCGLEGT